MPQTLQSSKRLQNDDFTKLFVRVSGWGRLRGENVSRLPAKWFLSLGHSGEDGESSPESSRRSRAPKSFKMFVVQNMS